MVYLQFLLPASFRKWTVIACHNMFGHIGMECFFWPEMNEDVRTHIWSCSRCVRFKQNQEQAPMVITEMSYPLKMAHMDFLTIGRKGRPVKEINVLVVTDHFTVYAQCYITSNQMTKTVVETLYNGFLVHYGWPERIHSDQGGGFKSLLIKELCDIAKVGKSLATPYHQEGNAQVECFNQMLIRMI